MGVRFIAYLQCQSITHLDHFRGSFHLRIVTRALDDLQLCVRYAIGQYRLVFGREQKILAACASSQMSIAYARDRCRQRLVRSHFVLG